MVSIKYEDNVDKVIAQLKQAGIAIQDAGADALNMGAHQIQGRYKKDLKNKKRLRNERFTLGGIMLFKARAMRSDKKTLRKMEDINAVVGVRQLRNGTHYLATMEVGGQKPGNSKTGKKVPIPMATARGGNINKAISPKYRLSKSATVTQYQGVLRSAGNARQQYAILHSLSGSGKIKPGMYQSDDAVYSVTKKEVVMVRRIKDSVTVKPAPLFESATMTISQGSMDRYFVISANKRIRELG